MYVDPNKNSRGEIIMSKSKNILDGITVLTWDKKKVNLKTI
jgi:hypothetical protein